MRGLKFLARNLFGKLGIELRRVKNEYQSGIAFIKKKSIKPYKPRVIGQFLDDCGNSFDLYEGYRKKIWPGSWADISSRRTDSHDKNKEIATIYHGRRQVANMEAFIGEWGLSFSGKDILEIGAFSGAAAFAIAELGANNVQGIDVPSNFIATDIHTHEEINEWSKYLKDYREFVGKLFESKTNIQLRSKVKFRDLDVADLSGSSLWDMIVSWETLEHVSDPSAAFKSMYRALRPGGYVCHHYHPFFCESGGHYDTLDLPWGHVRLSPTNLKKYVRQFRQDEESISIYRLFKTLNRMTLSDLGSVISESGFEVITIEPVRDYGKKVELSILEECRLNYPNISIQDLTSSGVWVLAVKP